MGIFISYQRYISTINSWLIRILVRKFTRRCHKYYLVQAKSNPRLRSVSTQIDKDESSGCLFLWLHNVSLCADLSPFPGFLTAASCISYGITSLTHLPFYFLVHWSVRYRNVFITRVTVLKSLWSQNDWPTHRNTFRKKTTTYQHGEFNKYFWTFSFAPGFPLWAELSHVHVGMKKMWCCMSVSGVKWN